MIENSTYLFSYPSRSSDDEVCILDIKRLKERSEVEAIIAKTG